MAKARALSMLAPVAMAAVMIIISGCIGNGGPSGGMNTVCIRGSCFSVELAVTPQERATGLMNRDSTEPGKGMLFIFEQEGVYSFWMKDTRMPLDMIWISADRKVVFIDEGAQPCRADPCPAIDPGGKALYVLEVSAGTVENAGIEIGDAVVLNTTI